MSVKVDPAVLRQFSSQVDSIAESTGDIKSDEALDGVTGALRGTDIDGPLKAAVTEINTAVMGITQRLQAVALLARGSANDYDMTDDECARSFKIVEVSR